MVYFTEYSTEILKLSDCIKNQTFNYNVLKKTHALSFIYITYKKEG